MAICSPRWFQIHSALHKNWSEKAVDVILDMFLGYLNPQMIIALR